MKKNINQIVIILFIVLHAGVLFAQTNGHMVIDSLDINGVYYIKITWDGEPHPTEWYKNEGEFVRLYGTSEHGVFPEVFYFVKRDSLNIGDSWNGRFNGPVRVEVVDTVTISVPIGTFFTYETTYTDTSNGQINATFWFAKDIGFVKVAIGDLICDCVDYSIIGGSGYFPLHIGNEWRLTCSTGIDTGIDIDSEINISQIYQLHQNHPNPFNPETTISFSISQNSKVDISVYNIKGQRIKTLISENLQRGYHEVFWNGKDDYDNCISSGLYFYKLQSGGETITKKMLLLK